ncbi:small, acid-soluble spore protein, alpha/beta type [Selenihalanaerobacter shriftii]|uniref:Small, acid-soluble spore protein, alpha/beta type n=1 Tax=Selenihalanaerobacter shriftii TaxID=142842 RepID=A0A1T4LSF9_9FIRM|nr:small, acid-soluble spore protein, alpha/beta type [Selenihalanaerobacter shriftii]SJZ57643.1 Small, acid-soluble spore protein, alpha/beta type [Selenihalanaerobacter shriftii]
MDKQKAMNKFKLEIAQELGYIDSPNNSEYRNNLNQIKFDVAQKENVPLQRGYNGNLKAKDAGKIGGNLGGQIGGQMVKKMIKQAENAMVNDYY